jgi:hypothetical protein
MAGSPLFLPIGDDFRVSTWLAIGACLYAALTRALPLRIVIYPPVLLLVVRLGQTLLATKSVQTAAPNTLWGRYTTKIPAQPDDQAIVVFVLGARINQYVSCFSRWLRTALILQSLGSTCARILAGW